MLKILNFIKWFILIDLILSIGYLISGNVDFTFRNVVGEGFICLCFWLISYKIKKV